MEKHAFQPHPAQIPVEDEVSVLVITGDGKSEVGQMHADLMHAPSAKLCLKQGVARKAREPTEHGMRALPLRADVSF